MSKDCSAKILQVSRKSDVSIEMDTFEYWMQT